MASSRSRSTESVVEQAAIEWFSALGYAYVAGRYCAEWTEAGDPCSACGRDPRTGDPWPEPLRHVRLETGHALRTWDTGRTARGRTCIGYELTDADGRVIFTGDDFRPSPCHADDADATLRALLGFLTLRPGDTDADYFADYTPAQREFAASSACELLGYLYGDDGPGEFVDLDGADGSDGCADAAAAGEGA